MGKYHGTVDDEAANSCQNSGFIANGSVSKTDQTVHTVDPVKHHVKKQAKKDELETSQIMASKAIVIRLLGADRLADAEKVLQRLDAKFSSSELEIIRADVAVARGDTCEATNLYNSVLSQDPDHIEALKAVAQLHHCNGILSESLTCLQKVAALVPEDKDNSGACAHVLVDLGNQAKVMGDQKEAETMYESALAAFPEHGSALYNLGVLSGEQGQVERAINLYERAVCSSSSHVQAWTNLGVLRRQQGSFEGALAALKTALALAPNNPVIRSNMAMLYVDMGTCSASSSQASAATDLSSGELFEMALAYDPTNTDALYSLGVMEGTAQHWKKSIFYYETCIRLNPLHALAWNNLGTTYQQVDNMEQAILCYTTAIQACPTFYQSMNNLGVIYTTQGQYGEGRRLFESAIFCKADYAEACNNLGVLLRDTGLIDEAIVHYKKCMHLCPESPNAFQNHLLALNYRHSGENAIVCSAHADWGTNFQAEVTPLPAPDPAEWRAPGDGKLRVGYVSPDLYTHSVSYFAEAPLMFHNRDTIELFVYCVTPCLDSKSQYLKADCLAKGATWRHVVDMTEPDLAELIRSDKVDILIELTGHTAHNKLGMMRYRPAPVQMTWIGYPNSTGLPSIDYRITDSVSDPLDTQQTYVEKLIRLPDVFLCYTPMRNPPDVPTPPCLKNGYITFGSFNALAKITDTVILTWSAILNAIPESRLILKNKPFACAEARAIWLAKFWEHGIDSYRIDLLPLTAGTSCHLEQYSLIDISLDPWPYAGTTTTCESLFMGVPCITLKGDCHAHNVGVTLLSAVGLTDWISDSHDEYVAIAKKWAAHPHELADVHKGLRNQMLSSVLCDATTFMGHLEAEYQRCFLKWRSDDTQKLEAQ